MLQINETTTSKRHILFFFLLALHIVLGAIVLKNYMPWRSFNFIIAVLCLPLVTVTSLSNKKTYRFLIVATILTAIAFVVPVKTIVFLALVCSAMGLVELFYGRASVIPFLVVLIISPLSYVLTVFSFPVRMWLTQVAATILNYIKGGTIALGNVIKYGGSEYVVDPACMGLKMLTTSLWFGLYLLYVISKKNKKGVSVVVLLICVCLLFCFNVVTNLIRIITLVLFDIPESSTIHYVVGLVCFIVYTILPCVFTFHKLIKNYGGEETEPYNKYKDESTPIAKVLLPILLLLLLVLPSAQILERNSGSPQFLNAGIRIHGYDISMFDEHIIQLKSEKALVYIKKIPGFYSSEHNPLMCWIGSGYEFEQLNKQQISSKTIYTGTLKSGNDILYTAWWYDNGERKTISQIDWRLDMLKGSSGYAVVNLTCNTKQDLSNHLKTFLETDVLNPVFE